MIRTILHPWMVHPHTGKPLEALGFKRNGDPIWPIMGASEDDDSGDDGAGDDDDDGADDGDGDDDGDEDDPDAGKSPEDLRAELRALRAAKDKLLREAKNRSKSKPKDDDGKGKDTLTREDVDDLIEETKAAQRQELMPAIIRTQSRSVLADLGMAFDKDKTKAAAQLSRVLKLADTDGLDLGDDGEVEGLEHALRAVKRDFPQLFRGTRPPRVGNASGNGRPSTKPKTATELQAAALFGGGDDD